MRTLDETVPVTWSQLLDQYEATLESYERALGAATDSTTIEIEPWVPPVDPPPMPAALVARATDLATRTADLTARTQALLDGSRLRHDRARHAREHAPNSTFDQLA